MKSKVEKERYKHLNAEFQRIARRDKKAFLSDCCKEIEENYRMGKKKMGETNEGLFGEAGDRQGPLWRDLIQNDWGCLPEGGEEEGLKLYFFFFFCLREWLRESPRKLLETCTWGSCQLRIL